MRAFTGEVIGTFTLVFVGLSSVINAAILDSYSGLFQVATLWGIGLTIAIFLSRSLSGAHLNPAITLCFASLTDFSWRKVPVYLIAQCIGAFIAACLIYLIFGNPISSYEVTNNLLRGTTESVRTAMVFGEFYPNPAATNDSLKNIGTLEAFLTEGIGTALLAFIIFSLISIKDIPSWLIPFLIGGTLTILISLLAPISMAGFNPARDLMPRIFSSLIGWKNTPFSYNGTGWITVYILAPIIGAQIGGGVAKLVCRGN